jgi:type II secretion system protein H
MAARLQFQGGVRREHRAAGFSLLEVVVVVAVLGVIAGIAVPSISSAMRLFALDSAADAVGAALRSARYAAVSKNRSVRVRFNCPSANQYRIVEVVGTTAIDTAANRCNETAYPYPDPDASAAPNIDGPVVPLPDNTQFGAVQDVEFNSTGRATPLTGCPACVTATPPASVTVTNGTQTRTVTIAASGTVVVP